MNARYEQTTMRTNENITDMKYEMIWNDKHLWDKACNEIVKKCINHAWAVE